MTGESVKADIAPPTSLASSSATARGGTGARSSVSEPARCTLWVHEWRAEKIYDELLPSVDLERLGVRTRRLNRTVRCAVAAAVAADRGCDRRLSRHGDRSGLVLGLHWLSDEGGEKFVTQVAEGAYSATAVQDFAHMGGPPVLHYVSRLLGLRGYSTCVSEANSWDQMHEVEEAIVRSRLVDQLLTVRIELVPDDEATRTSLEEAETTSEGRRLSVASERIRASVVCGGSHVAGDG